MPSRGWVEPTAVTSTMVSPERMSAAPLACSAMWPVSTVSFRPV